MKDIEAENDDDAEDGVQEEEETEEEVKEKVEKKEKSKSKAGKGKEGFLGSMLPSKLVSRKLVDCLTSFPSQLDLGEILRPVSSNKLPVSCSRGNGGENCPLGTICP